jgi:hypothetical protein
MTSAKSITPLSAIVDAYIHYAPADSAFAHQTLSDGLRAQYSLFLHHNDGRDASTALDIASRVVLVASNDYMLNEVAQDEMRTIMERMRQTGRDKCVIVVVLNDSEKRHLKKCFSADANYVRWSDPAFWKKLRYYLPEPSSGIGGVGSGEKTIRQSSALTTSTSVPRTQNADYEDDMWTYLKGAGSGSSGQDSSLSTRSTTDNSNTTLPPPMNMSMVSTGATNSRRRPNNNMSLKPKSTTATAGGRSAAQQRRSATTARKHVLENPLENHYDGEYMSVVGSSDDTLARRHVNPPLPEPIYHTLEPPTEEANGVRKVKKKAGKNDSTVYINEELEVVYPKVAAVRGGVTNGTRGSRNTPQNGYFDANGGVGQQHFLQMLQNGVDDEDDCYADQEEDEELLQNELDFDVSQNSFDDVFSSSRSQLGSCGAGGGYVPSPAPGSMPRKQFTSGRQPQQPRGQLQQQQTSRMANGVGNTNGRMGVGKQPSYYI